MITKNRKTTLHWVMSKTAFEAINKDSLISLTRPLGTSVSAVNQMTSASEEMAFLLPSILGTSPESTSGNWQQDVTNYWHNFGLEVSQEGMPLDISFSFDITDPTRKEYIDVLIDKLGLNKPKKAKKEDKKEESKETETVVEQDGEESSKYYTLEEKEEKLAEYVMNEIKEEFKFRYGTPVNIPQYLAWRYCLVSNLVGNDPDVMVREGKAKEGELKSSRIQFYLLDENLEIKRKEKLQKIRNEAIVNYNSLLTSKSTAKLDNMVIAADLIRSIEDLKSATTEDKQSYLLTLAVENPVKFADLFKDESIAKTAEVKKFVMASLIRNIPNTTLYTDGEDATMSLGSSFSEVVGYLHSSVNSAYLNQLRLKMNSYMK